jgi:hypothetical protein
MPAIARSAPRYRMHDVLNIDGLRAPSLRSLRPGQRVGMRRELYRSRWTHSGRSVGHGAGRSAVLEADAATVRGGVPLLRHALAAGQRAVYHRPVKQVECLSCSAGGAVTDGESSRRDDATAAAAAELSLDESAIDAGKAGASARREYFAPGSQA